MPGAETRVLMALKKEIMAKGKSKGKRPLRRNEVVPATANHASDRRPCRLVNEDVGTTSTALEMKLKLVHDIVGSILGQPTNAIQPQLATIPESGTELVDSEQNSEEEPVVEETDVGAPLEKFFNLLMLVDVAATSRRRSNCNAKVGDAVHN